jgi:hypothetical protein
MSTNTRLRVEIGNPETDEWQKSCDIDLEEGEVIFKKKHPSITYPADIMPENYGLHNYKLKLRSDDFVELIVGYIPNDNGIGVFIKHNSKSIFQVDGTAFDKNGLGISLIFELPNSNYPVSITFENHDYLQNLSKP